MKSSIPELGFIKISHLGASKTYEKFYITSASKKIKLGIIKEPIFGRPLKKISQYYGFQDYAAETYCFLRNSYTTLI